MAVTRQFGIEVRNPGASKDEKTQSPVYGPVYDGARGASEVVGAIAY